MRDEHTHLSKAGKTRGNRRSAWKRACHSPVQSCLVVQHGHRIGGSVTFSNREAGTDGRCNEILSGSHAFSNFFLMDQIGCDGRSEDATGTVRVLGVDTLSARLSEFTVVVEKVRLSVPSPCLVQTDVGVVPPKFQPLFGADAQ